MDSDTPPPFNVADVPLENHPDAQPIMIPDLLVNMYMKQLNHKIEYDKIYREKGLTPTPQDRWGQLDDPQLQAELRSTAGYMMQELFEALNLLKNKPWKQTPRHTDPAEFLEEIADVWHFWLELHILAGINPEDILRAYFGKSAENDDRRERGY